MEHEDWEKAFKMIELENNLAHHRFTGLLALQGFLFTVLIFGINGLASKDYALPYSLGIPVALMIVCIVGGISPWLIRDGLVAAYRQVLAAAEWLEDLKNDPKLREQRPYPPIIGRPKGIPYQFGDPKHTDSTAVRTLSVGTITLPILLTSAWTLFFLILLAMTIWKKAV